MDSKTYNKDLRKNCVKAVFDEFAEHGDMIRPQYAEQWDEIYASRFLGHITGPMDIDVPDLVDGIQNIALADFTSAEIEGIAYQLNRKVGNTR